MRYGHGHGHGHGGVVICDEVIENREAVFLLGLGRRFMYDISTNMLSLVKNDYRVIYTYYDSLNKKLGVANLRNMNMNMDSRSNSFF